MPNLGGSVLEPFFGKRKNRKGFRKTNFELGANDANHLLLYRDDHAQCTVPATGVTSRAIR
jgi:hypothetical protein